MILEQILPLAIIDKLPLGRLLWKQELTLTFSLCMYNIHLDKIRPSWTLDIVTWFYFNLIIQDIDPKLRKVTDILEFVRGKQIVNKITFQCWKKRLAMGSKIRIHTPTGQTQSLTKNLILKENMNEIHFFVQWSGSRWGMLLDTLNAVQRRKWYN